MILDYSSFEIKPPKEVSEGQPATVAGSGMKPITRCEQESSTFQSTVCSSIVYMPDKMRMPTCMCRKLRPLLPTCAFDFQYAACKQVAPHFIVSEAK